MIKCFFSSPHCFYSEFKCRKWEIFCSLGLSSSSHVGFLCRVSWNTKMPSHSETCWLPIPTASSPCSSPLAQRRPSDLGLPPPPRPDWTCSSKPSRWAWSHEKPADSWTPPDWTPPFPPSVCADHQHHCEERRGLAGRAALSGQPAQTSVGQRGLPGKASQRQHVRHQLEGAQAASILSAKLLQVCGLLQNKIASSRKNFESGN